MNAINKFWDWLLLSSANPDKYSLAIKGFFGTLATMALLWSGIFHYNLSATDITDIGNLVSVAVFDLFTAVSYIATAISGWTLVVGAVRKLVLTVIGANKVLNS